MMLRLFALFTGKQKVVYPLTGLFILSYTVSFVFGAVTLFQLRSTSSMCGVCTRHLTCSSSASLEYHPLAHVCLGGSNNQAWAGIFCAVLLFELLILMMTARKLYQQARLAGDASLSPLLEVLYRDNFSYYILMFFTRIVNIYIVSHGTSIIYFMCFDNVDLVGGPSCSVLQSWHQFPLGLCSDSYHTALPHVAKCCHIPRMAGADRDDDYRGSIEHCGWQYMVCSSS